MAHSSGVAVSRRFEKQLERGMGGVCPKLEEIKKTSPVFLTVDFTSDLSLCPAVFQVFFFVVFLKVQAVSP